MKLDKKFQITGVPSDKGSDTKDLWNDKITDTTSVEE